MAQPNNRTLFGYPVETSFLAPTDRIILHPQIAAEIENQAIVVSELKELKEVADGAK